MRSECSCGKPDYLGTANDHLFEYAQKTRQELWEKLHVRFNQLIIDMKIEGEQRES
jgi:hypothetical protein